MFRKCIAYNIYSVKIDWTDLTKTAQKRSEPKRERQDRGVQDHPFLWSYKRGVKIKKRKKERKKQKL